MIKITVDAGHGSWKDKIKKLYATPGKRTPDGIPEWEFNNKVIKAFINYLSHYQDVAVLRVDDPTGKTDVPLKDRATRAASWGTNAHFSCHHNALGSTWRDGGIGIETLVRPNTTHYANSLKLAKLVHPKYVKAMGLKDRGIKDRTDLYMLSNAMPCPVILTEGGFMDSRVDNAAMKLDAKLKAQGEAIAQGYVEFFNLKKKEENKVEYITLTSGQQNAVDKLVKHGMLEAGFKFPNDDSGRTLLTFVTIQAPLLTKLEQKGSI